MKTAMVATATVADVLALRDQLLNLKFGDSSYYLLQRADDITSWKEGPPDAMEIEAYTQGRLFGKEAEIRWKKTANNYALLWLSAGKLPDGFTKSGDWETSTPQRVFLLGGGDTKPWRDTRIPRKLNYPMKWCPSPQVEVIQYRECQSQIIRFTRYTAFVK